MSFHIAVVHQKAQVGLLRASWRSTGELKKKNVGRKKKKNFFHLSVDTLEQNLFLHPGGMSSYSSEDLGN